MRCIKFVAKSLPIEEKRDVNQLAYSVLRLCKNTLLEVTPPLAPNRVLYVGILT